MMGEHHLVFTVIATDRPGLVKRLADAIAESGGNWVDSSMSRLGGEFAGIVSIEIPAGRLGDLHHHFDRLIADGIAITLRSEPQAAEEVAGISASLEVVCQDHPGILRDVTQVLTGLGISIETLETSVAAGSMQGERLFTARAELRLPEGVTAAAVSAALEETAGDLMADIKITD